LTPGAPPRSGAAVTGPPACRRPVDPQRAEIALGLRHGLQWLRVLQRRAARGEAGALIAADDVEHEITAVGRELWMLGVCEAEPTPSPPPG
jgi:hypothetical protein